MHTDLKKMHYIRVLFKQVHTCAQLSNLVRLWTWLLTYGVLPSFTTPRTLTVIVTFFFRDTGIETENIHLLLHTEIKSQIEFQNCLKHTCYPNTTHSHPVIHHWSRGTVQGYNIFIHGQLSHKPCTESWQINNY